MTDTTIAKPKPKTTPKEAVTDAATVNAVQEKVQRIIREMNETHFERPEIIGGIWTAATARQHILQVGPGGSGKSFIARDFASRVIGANYFEVALDETTTPDQILGAPDIKSMVEEGKVRRVPDGMLPTAHIAFLDEFFNANGPALHAIMPILNERVFHNNGKPVPVPLRVAIMGTNKLNADQDQAALWDRVHHRHQTPYVADRDNMRALLNAAVLRQSGTYVVPEPTTISIDELDIAFEQAMLIEVPDVAFTTFQDLMEELGRSGVVVSTRRQVEGLKAVLASAWVAGHDEVKVGDLSVLRHMLWSRQEDITTVKNIVLTACNPGEKQALDLLDDLDQLKADYAAASDLDSMKRNTAAIDIFKKAQALIDKASPLKDTATAAGASTNRIDDLIGGADLLRVKIGKECFDMDEEQVKALPANRR